MSEKMKRLSRRRFLKGTVAGMTVSLGLPFLDEFVPYAKAQGNAIAGAGGYHRRFFSYFIPYGCGPYPLAQPSEVLQASDAAAGNFVWQSMNFTPTSWMEPLLAARAMDINGIESGATYNFLDRMMLLSGLTGNRADGNHYSDHGRGCYIPSGGLGVDNMVSNAASGSMNHTLEVAFGKHLQAFTNFKTTFEYLNIAGQGSWNESQRSNCIDNGALKLPDTNPRKLFNKIFGSGTPGGVTGGVDGLALQKKSILDGVYQQMKTLENRVGQRDRIRLQQYMSEVESIERSIASTPTVQCTLPSVSDFGDWNTSHKFDASVAYERWCQLSQLVSLALICGVTRSISFAPLLDNSDGANLGKANDFIPKSFYSGRYTAELSNKIQTAMNKNFHDMSHWRNSGGKNTWVNDGGAYAGLEFGRYFMTFFGSIMARLRSEVVVDPHLGKTTNLADATLANVYSAYSEADNHNPFSAPNLILAGPDYGLNTGKAVVCGRVLSSRLYDGNYREVIDPHVSNWTAVLANEVMGMTQYPHSKIGIGTSGKACNRDPNHSSRSHYNTIKNLTVTS